MKKLKILSIASILAMLVFGYACEEDVVVINSIKVILTYSEGIETIEGVTVKARSTDQGTEYEKQTDNTGSATFELPVGDYEFTASEVRTSDGKLTAFNALLNKIIGDDWDETTVLELVMNGSTKSQIIIKELYTAGCPKDDDSGVYSYGQYITLYNNSTENVDLQNLCLGTLLNNSQSMSSDIKEGETEVYWFKEDWTPASTGYFYFPNSTILEPGKELVVAISGGIDHTATYSQCVDLSASEYYVCYDIDVFTHSGNYPAPSANIDPSHYLEGVKYGLGTAVAISKNSPAFFLFYPEGQTPYDYGMDISDNDYWKDNDKFPRKKVPADWIVDAIEGFADGEEDNKKRVNPLVDAGYVYLTKGVGYSLYRNVDKEATEAIEGNSSKLVYGYNLGTDAVADVNNGSTDPSGIDAEASIANGAVIIFKDTNNSTNDFHQRQKSSLRD